MAYRLTGTKQLSETVPEILDDFFFFIQENAFENDDINCNIL